MIRMIKTSCLAISCLLTVGYAAGSKDMLVYSYPSNVGEINPHMYSPNQMFAQAMIYEPLVTYGAGGKVLPWLAEKWKISPDGKIYTFTLRKGVVFSDGTPFNAAAVKKNFDAVVMNLDRHKWLELINQIDRAEVVNDLTFKLTLKHAYYPTLQELCLIRPLRFMSPAAMPENGNTSAGIKQTVGTGPWILVEKRKGEYDLFVRNERYWGQKPSCPKLMVKVISDPNARAIALETGDIDLVYGSAGSGQISVDAFERFSKDPRYVTKISAPMATRAIVLNSRRGATSELAVRKAILQSIDKDSILKNVFYGIERPADTIFSPDSPYCNLGLKPYRLDRSKAGKLLDETGWKLPANGKVRVKSGQDLSIDLCFVGNNAQDKTIAEVVQGDLAKVGIRVNLIGEEADSIGARQKNGEFNLIFESTWGAPYDPHSFCSSMRAPSHADYQAQLGLPMKKELDARISEVLLSTNEKKRAATYRWILTTLQDQAIYLPVSYTTQIIVHPRNISGAEFGSMNYEMPFEKIRKQ